MCLSKKKQDLIKSQDVSSVDHFGTGTSGQLNKTAKAARSSKFGNNKQKVSRQLDFHRHELIGHEVYANGP